MPNDLDFFIGHADVDADTISTMVAAVERALGEAGIGSQREVVSDTFARLTVVTEDEECRIDLAVDVRIRPVEQDPQVALVSLEELAADKILALFGRAAARDYQDVAALRRHFSWTVLFELASEKDAGFSVERFLDAVAAFARLDADEHDELVAVVVKHGGSGDRDRPSGRPRRCGHASHSAGRVRRCEPVGAYGAARLVGAAAGCEGRGRRHRSWVSGRAAHDRSYRPPPPVRLEIGTECRDERVPHDVAYQLILTSRWPALASIGT